MGYFNNYRLVEEDGEYILEIMLGSDMEEFAKEFLSDEATGSSELESKAKELIKEKYANIKVKSIKFIVGTAVIAIIPLYVGSVTAQAANAPTASIAQTVKSTSFYVTASKLNVRSGPSTSYSIIHALWNGNRVTIISETGNWYRIRLSDGRIGFVSKDYIRSDYSSSGTVTASQLNVRQGPSTSELIFHTLWKGNKVSIIGVSNGWCRIRLSDGRIGWVSGEYITEAGSSQQQKIDKVVSLSKSLIGTPYVFGGKSPADGGFDCSGLTVYVFGQVGYTLNRISTDQATQGVFVSSGNKKAGDLVFFSINGTGKVDHVGIYIGNGQMIHSPKPGDTVKTVSIDTSYWQQRYISTRRIIY